MIKDSCSLTKIYENRKKFIKTYYLVLTLPLIKSIIYITLPLIKSNQLCLCVYAYFCVYLCVSIHIEREH